MTLNCGKNSHSGADNQFREIALFGAFCLFLSALDHLIPKPLPFMRLGLANLPLLIALDIFSVKSFFLLVFVKILGQALITGTLFSHIILFSLTGTVFSAACMFFLRRTIQRKNADPAKPNQNAFFSLIGISVIGAFASNAIQLVLARYLLFGEGILYLAPPILAAGIISGGLQGFFAEVFSAQSQWLALMRTKTTSPELIIADGIIEKQGLKDTPGMPEFGFSFRQIILLCLAVFFLLVPDLSFRAVLFLLFWVWALIEGKKTRPVITVMSIVTIIICNLFPPFGKIIFQYGFFTIASGSLLRGLQRAVTMAGLIMFSKLALGKSLPLPGKWGFLLNETFLILERINKAFFNADFSAQNAAEKKQDKKIEGFLKKLDGILCEISALN